MPTDNVYLIEVKSCPGFVLVGRERDAELEAMGDDPEGQKWTVDSVFEPDTGVIGWVVKNVATGGCLKFDGRDQSVQMGSPRSPVQDDVVWAITPREDGPNVFVAPVTDNDQALDKSGKDGCRTGARVQTWGANRGDNQQWRFTATAS